MSKHRVFDSMASAAGALGVSKDTLRAAKESPDGPKIFRGSRVVEAEFLKWAASHNVETKPGALTLRDQKTQEEIRKLRIKNDRDAGKLILKTEVAGAIRRALAGVASLCEAKLVHEFPAACAGQDLDSIRVYGRQLHDRLMEEGQKLAKEFPE